jgi:hypothetical protein
MTDKNLPSVEYLRKRLRYEPETGKLFWLDCEDMPQKWLARWADKEAFTAISVWGYRVGRINSLSFRAHRVAYAIYYGSWPRDQIDHINGVRSDNRISNLRGVTHQENMRNQSMHVNNTSGVCGVNWCRNTLKWRAQININGRNKSLGYYTTLEGATEARVKASRQHGYMDRHGT